MATEEAIAPTPLVSESAKLIVPTEKEEGELDLKKIIVIAIGYASLIFALLALFFPLWIDHSTTPNNFISLWRIFIESSAAPFYHWEILWYYNPFFSYIVLSSVVLVILCVVLYKLIRRGYNLVMHDWKEPSPGNSYFWLSLVILLSVVGVSYFLPEFVVTDPMVTAPYTVLYGPSWGLGFAWYALLIAGILGMIYTKLKEIFEKPKEEDWKAI